MGTLGPQPMETGLGHLKVFCAKIKMVARLLGIQRKASRVQLALLGLRGQRERLVQPDLLAQHGLRGLRGQLLRPVVGRHVPSMRG